jgi:hypothetical protein
MCSLLWAAFCWTANRGFRDRTGGQKPGFLPEYLAVTDRFSKKPGFLGQSLISCSNRGFPGCTGGRGRSVSVGSDRAVSGATQ